MSTAEAGLYLRLGAALLIGLLIGMERERVPEPGRRRFAGARTFPLLALLGAVVALAADEVGAPLVFGVALLVIGALVTTAYIFEARKGHLGVTTEVAALITVLIGALCYWERAALAAALGVATTLLLSAKVETHTFATRLSSEDLIAILKFGVISVVILPVLPDQSIGPPPLDVVNPYRAWLLVVLISGISFLGYALHKVLGAERGIGLTGLLGGLASSTAVTVSMSQRSKEREGLVAAMALAITVSWVMMYARVAVEVAAVNRALLPALLPSLVAAALGGLAWVAVLAWRRVPGETEGAEDDVPLRNPFSLRPALTFGVLYLVILVAMRAGQLWLGTAGLFVTSMAAGLVDVDAITLSMAELSTAPDGLAPATAATAITLAVFSNTLVKAGIVMLMASRALRLAFLPGFGLIVAAGAVGLWVW